MASDDRVLPGAAGITDEALCVLPTALPLHEASRVLVLAPHPDDECIGCGGLILRLRAMGVPVGVVLVSDGSGAGGLPPGADLVRQEEFRRALIQLGVAHHALLGFPDGGLQPDERLCDAVLREVTRFAPDWLVCPSAADVHRDHRAVAVAAQRAAQAHAGVHRLVQYETWAALPATHVLDITDVHPRKLAALAEHHTALAQRDYAGAATGLARYRGLLVEPQRPQAMAEAFLCTSRQSGFAWWPGWGRPID